MDPAALTAWLELGAKLGLGFTAACALCIWWLSKGKLRWDWDVERCEKESKEWQQRAETDTALVAKSTAALERNTEALEQLLARVKRLETRRP